MSAVSAPSSAQRLALLEQIVHTTRSGLIVYEAIRGEAGQIIDFRAILCNQAGADSILQPIGDILNKTFLERYSNDGHEPLFQEYINLVENGGEFHQVQYLARQDRWYEVSAVKLLDGFLVTFEDVSDVHRASQQLQIQADLLGNILDSSLNGVVAYEAIRDTTGEIVDFRLVLINKAAVANAGNLVSFAVGYTMRQIYPDTEQSGLFSEYKKVCETGVAIRREHYYTKFDYWVDIAITRLNDGVLINYTDLNQTKQLELQHRAHMQLLDQVLNSSFTAIFAARSVRNATGDVVDLELTLVNDAYQQMVGYPADQLVGRRFLELCPYIAEAGYWPSYKVAIDTGQAYRFEAHYQWGDEVHWYDVSVRPWEDGVVVNSIDSTVSRQIRRQLAETAAMLQGVLDSAPAGVIQLRAVRNQEGQITDFRVMAVNKSTVQILRQSPEQMIGQVWSTIYPHYKDYGLMDRYIQVVETGTPQTFETYYNDDGIEGWFQVTAVRQDDGFILTVLDITETKQAQVTQQELATMLANILDASMTSFSLLDSVRNEAGDIENFRYRLVNKAFLEFTQLKQEDVLGKHLTALFPETRETGILDRYKQVVETGSPQVFEQYYPVGTQEFWFTISAYRQGDGVVVSFLEISPIKQAQKELERMIEKLQQSNYYLEQFAYVASHDLQEPLRKIQSFGDILLGQYATMLDENGIDLLNRMKSATERMQVLVRDLLAYSRLSTYQAPFRRVSLASLTAEVIGDLDAIIREKKATIDVGMLPDVPGDSLQLRQLLQNLISNALKFSRPGQEPVVHIQAFRPLPEQLPEALRPDEKHCVAVQVVDNGIGFDTKYRERIFQLFQRLNGRSSYSGTGIGLAICKKVAENHGGVILADSTPGQGSTFTVYLPTD
ncbi:hypothetical protein GCM10023187_15210 [Nibrella viscosa]|uniref:histidine kinase n=1 Tax=Nibrella viscosa TaxID=1084524 RepID=A0ABP8K682_9BACT